MTTIIIGGGLASGDEVLMYFEAAARHFGIKIEETIIAAIIFANFAFWYETKRLNLYFTYPYSRYSGWDAKNELCKYRIK